MAWAVAGICRLVGNKHLKFKQLPFSALLKNTFGARHLSLFLFPAYQFSLETDK